MCKRIYKKYGIRITDNEGTRLVRLNKNVRMEIFEIARNTYNTTKNMYENKNEDITIELVGITQEDQIGNVIYSKQFVREVISEDEILMDKTDDIVETIKENLEVLIRKREYHQNMMCVMDKKQQVILHNIEQMSGMSDVEKLNILADLESIRNKRRFHKEEFYKISRLNSIVNLDNVNELFSRVEIPIEREFEFLDKNKLESLNIMKEVVYNSEKDKIHKLEQLQKKYEKVVDDCVSKTLVCYNKAKKLK